MVVQLNLEKSAAKIQLILDKHGVDRNLIAAVGLNIDVSGSMQDLFRSGAVQRVVEQITPVGLRFDDNGNLDVWVFSHEVAQLQGATKDNYEGYVQREILQNSQLGRAGDDILWHGTNYGPVIRANLEEYGLLRMEKVKSIEKVGGGIFSRSREVEVFTDVEKIVGATTTGYPAINYFLTDGENDDHEAAWELFEQAEAAKAPIYYMFVGIGNARFRFIKEAADKFGNVGFLSVADLSHFVNSDDIYEQLLGEELCEWLPKKK